MKILFLDCSMGAAGDMLTAALFELLEEPEQEALLRQLNALGLPGVVFTPEKVSRCGILGTHMRVSVDGVEEGAEHHHDRDQHDHSHEQTHDHDHPHNHAHSHHHSNMADIEKILDALPVSEKARADAKGVYALLAGAESDAHGVPVSEIHFHEVGTMDAVADITAVCLLLERLAPKKVLASPVRAGFGQVRCAHGLLPVPAPATAYLLRGIPTYAGEIEGELCTPTGAALLKYFVTEFAQMPPMTVEKVGYGCGRKDLTAANVVRALLGTAPQGNEQILEFTCSIDDETPERVGFALEQLFAAGALEAYALPALMKKSRPGVLLCAMCREHDRDAVLRCLFRHTTTLGVREQISRRYTLERHVQTIETPLGQVRVKRARGYGVTREKYEYDDLAAIARAQGLSIGEVIKEIERK